MSTIGDIAKVLEQIPIWKKLTALPAQIEALNGRIAALEAELRQRPAQETCPICEAGTLKVTAVRDHRMFGDMGIKERVLRCTNTECGHTENRMYDPTDILSAKKK